MIIKTKKLSIYRNYLALISKAGIPYPPPFSLNPEFLFIIFLILRLLNVCQMKTIFFTFGIALLDGVMRKNDKTRQRLEKYFLRLANCRGASAGTNTKDILQNFLHSLLSLSYNVSCHRKFYKINVNIAEDFTQISKLTTNNLFLQNK